MVKSYLKYNFEGAFGTVASASCASVESLSPEYVLSSDDHCVNLWSARLGEAKLRFEYRLDEFNAPSLVTCFALARPGGNGKPSPDVNYLFVGYKNGLIRRFALPPEAVTRLAALSRPESVADDCVLFGHGAAVSALSLRYACHAMLTTLSATHQLLLSGGADSHVLVWDVYNCQLLHKLLGHRGAILSIAFCAIGAPVGGSAADGAAVRPDGAPHDTLGFAFSAGADGTVKAWDVLNEACVQTLVEPLLKPASLLLAGVGGAHAQDCLFVAYANNNAINAYRIESVYGGARLLYAISTGSAARTKFMAALPPGGADGAARQHAGADTAQSEQGGVIIAIQSHSVHVFETLNARERAARRAKRLKRINEKLKAKVAKLRAALSVTGRVATRAFDTVRGEYDYLRRLLAAGGADADGVAEGAPDAGGDNYAEGESEGAPDASAAEDAFAFTDFYRPLAAYGVGDLVGDDAVAEIVAFRLRGRHAVLALSNNSVHVLRLASGWPQSADDESSGQKLFAPLHAVNRAFHTAFVRAVALSPSNKLLLTVAGDALRLWSTHTSAVVHSAAQLAPQGAEAVRIGAVTHAVFITDATLLLAHGRGLALYNLSTGACAALDYELGDDALRGLHFNAAASELLVVCGRSVRRLSLDTEGCALAHIASSDPGQEVTLSRVGGRNAQPDAAFRTLYLALANHSVLALRCDSLRAQQTLYGHALGVVGLALSDDGALLATCSLDRTVKLWSVRFGNILRSAQPDAAAVTQLDFIAGTHYLVCLAQRAVVLLDCDAFATIARLPLVRPTRAVAVGKFGVIYVASANGFGLARFARSGEIVLAGEQEDVGAQPAAEYKINRLDALSEAIGQLADGECDGGAEGAKLGGTAANVNSLLHPERLVFTALLATNASALHGVLLALPRAHVERVSGVNHQLTAFVCDLLARCAAGGPDMRLANAELLATVALATARLFLRQLDVATAYRLRRLVGAVLADYMDTVRFNRAGLEFVRGAIAAGNARLIKRMK